MLYVWWGFLICQAGGVAFLPCQNPPVFLWKVLLRSCTNVLSQSATWNLGLNIIRKWSINQGVNIENKRSHSFYSGTAFISSSLLNGMPSEQGGFFFGFYGERACFYTQCRFHRCCCGVFLGVSCSNQWSIGDQFIPCCLVFAGLLFILASIMMWTVLGVREA